MKDGTPTDGLKKAWRDSIESDDFQPLDLATFKEEGRRLLSHADRLPSDLCIPALRKIH